MTEPTFAEGAGGGLQHLVAALIHIPQPRDHRVHFVFQQHERREKETGTQDVADASFTLDGPLALSGRPRRDRSSAPTLLGFRPAARPRLACDDLAWRERLQ
jgi:hypothetical protein